MCLAIPGRIIEILDNDEAVIDFMGVRKMASIALMEKIEVGDYVIVHAGFAINKLNREDALAAVECLKGL